MKLIFFGAPGSGKGTYASRSSPILGIPQISTGDLLRAEVATQSELGKKADTFMKSGNLVPDKLVIDMLKKRVEQHDCSKGYILDGFPRTIEQSTELEKFAKIDLVILFNMPEAFLIEKALARRVCEKCGNTYNIANIKKDHVHLPPLLPKVEGICDKCGGKLIQRKDDNEKVIRDRIETYKKQSYPLLDHYRNKNLVKEIEVIGPPDIMVPIVIKTIKEALGR